MNVKIIRLNKDLPLPEYQTLQSAGMDLYANVDESITIKHGEKVLIPTGLKIQLPSNYEMQLRSRSGLALKYGIIVLNSPATIDADFRGEVKVILINHGQDDFTIYKGDRIAQAVICKVYQASLVEVDELDETERGDGGFGHTGIGRGIFDGN